MNWPILAAILVAWLIVGTAFALLIGQAIPPADKDGEE